MSSATISAALEEWSALLGAERVRVDPEFLGATSKDTSRFSQDIAAVLVPGTADVIADIVRIAQRHAVPLYPVSTGHNWGYGTSNPPTPDCVVLSLKELCEISLDEDLGLVTLEPGVTQQQLYDFLSARGSSFIVPVTGAGPTASILGNALERGFGLAPVGDHFLALTALEAVLPNGETYRTPLSHLGSGLADRAFKWGLGPYLDGLFTQGNFGVVTKGTIALARRSECTTIFFFYVDEDSQLEQAVIQLQEVVRRYGANIGNINLMNRRRVELMNGAPRAESAQAANIIGSRSVPAWTGVGAIYGSRGVTAAIKREVTPLLKLCSRSVRFVDAARVLRLRSVLARLPLWLLKGTRARIEQLLPSLKILLGEPSTVALRLAYANAPEGAPAENIDPARDGRGVYWYSPLIPMRPNLVRSFVEMVKSVTERHGVPPAITLTSMSDRCFDSTVPILFSVDNDEESGRAEACYQNLFDSGRALGFTPYRMGSQNMHLVVQPNSVFWRFAAQLKTAADPGGIIAPGRYSLRDT